MSMRDLVLGKLIAYQNKYGCDTVVKTVWAFVSSLEPSTPDNRLEALSLMFDRVATLPWRHHRTICNIALDIVTCLSVIEDPARVVETAWVKSAEQVEHELAIVSHLHEEVSFYAEHAG